jgi:hypothetical protein
MVNDVLETMHDELTMLYVYAETSHSSIPPRRLPRASLIQPPYCNRSGRQLVQYIDFNLLYL